MDYVSCAVAVFCLSLLGIQLFPVKNGLSMYNRDLQILHAPMKNCDSFSSGGIPETLMHSYPSPWNILVSLFQMINSARLHDKYGLKMFWEEKIESHVQRMGNEDSRMNNSALSKCVCLSRDVKALLRWLLLLNNFIQCAAFLSVPFRGYFCGGNCIERLGGVNQNEKIILINDHKLAGMDFMGENWRNSLLFFLT